MSSAQPGKPVDPEQEPEGSGKQFARDVGATPERKEARKRRAAADAPEEADPGGDVDPIEPRGRDEGSGKQFARGVGEDRERRRPPSGEPETD